jgi:hypothetical protein
MKNLFVLLLASSALVSACGDDDDSVNDVGDGGAGGSSAGTSSTAGKAGSPSAGTSSAGTSSSPGGAGGEPTAGEGGEPTAGEGGMSAGAGGGASDSKMFTVTVENVAPVKRFTSGGVFNTPVGAATPGALKPGNSYEFTIDAGRKQKLSFATMLAATNDLFFAPDGDGIALYDENGDPISGFVTDQIYLWDAGTEVNEEPAVGPNTVTKQLAANTGVDEHGNVRKIGEVTTDTFDYPTPADVMTVSVTHTTGTQFKVTIMNVSSDMALMTSLGNKAAPLSPGVWVVHNGKNPLFTAGMPDAGEGVESIAEDGNPAALGAFIAANSGITYPASPGAWVVHTAGSMPLFTIGEADYGDGIEHIAEDGNPTALGASLPDLGGFIAGDVFNTPVGSDAPGPILPGKKYQFSFQASPGDALSFASMLAATNDVFFAPGQTGIELFDTTGEPLSGDISDHLALWDAGTEANEEPGIGPNTVTNQLAADTGEPGEDVVQLLSDVADDDYPYPAANAILKVTISAE